MDTMNYSFFRKNLSGTLDKVNAHHSPVLITRQNGEPAVLMSLEDFKSYEETFYLMKSPKNAQRLDQAIREVESGKIIEKKLIK